jgi:hypothetical protein
MGKVTIKSIFVNKFYSLLGQSFRLAFLAASRKKITADKPLSDIGLVLFSGQKGSKMMKAVLLSIYYSWEKIPRLTLVSDGTPKDVFEQALQFWPFPYEVKSWEDCAAYHLEKGRQSLVDYARINRYARKLLAVLAEGESRPIFYCDTDVLWFDQPRLPAPTPENGCVMRISSDNEHFYHLPAIRWLNRYDLLEKPAMNCGVVYLSGSVFENYPEFEAILQFMKIFNEPFSEQTSFALLADRLGDTWTREEIILSTEDTYWPLLPRYLRSGTQSGRHHVATKHSWFWRDALYITLFRRKKHPGAAAV